MQYRLYPVFLYLSAFISTYLISSCNRPVVVNDKALYDAHCGSCHLAPKIEELPRDIWENSILPEMAARMGLSMDDYNPLNGLSFDEQAAVLKTGLYHTGPLISETDWTRLEDYILSLAPDSLARTPEVDYRSITNFKERPIHLDNIPGSKNMTYLNFDRDSGSIIMADLTGEVMRYDAKQQTSEILGRFINPVVSYTKTASNTYATSIGQLNPTEIPTGQLFIDSESGFMPDGGYLHRPVHMLVDDLDDNGNEEIVISEFGNLKGRLSLFIKKEDTKYEKQVLLEQPGCIRVISRDMNQDQKTDLVVLTTQGNEGIVILYQEAPLKFRAERVLNFSPVYGSSWFELMDYDGDGDLDIFTVNGDNADKSYVHKPYHGFRIHLNNGKNQFEEAFFYPMYGATRLLANDFDQDGDMDFALAATFPDYEQDPLLSFVYLKNEDALNFKFSSEVLQDPAQGRWLLLETGDVDRDGDEDVILSPFTYVFTPVPDSLNTRWNSEGVDLLILENTLFDHE